MQLLRNSLGHPSGCCIRTSTSLISACSASQTLISGYQRITDHSPSEPSSEAPDEIWLGGRYCPCKLQAGARPLFPLKLWRGVMNCDCTCPNGPLDTITSMIGCLSIKDQEVCAMPFVVLVRRSAFSNQYLQSTWVPIRFVDLRSLLRVPQQGLAVAC